jgi:hypothetical protein
MANKKPLHLDSAMTREHAEWMREVDEKTSRLMVEWLKAGTDTGKPINTLNKAAFMALAEIARATYIGEVSDRRAKLRARDLAMVGVDVEQLDLWLL